MAFPFGGHPTLADYLAWVREGHGFTAETGVAHTASGKMVPIIRISKQGGPSVVVPGIKQTDRLAPSQVGQLDRRLGLNSPWFSVD